MLFEVSMTIRFLCFPQCCCYRCSEIQSDCDFVIISDMLFVKRCCCGDEIILYTRDVF